MPGDMEKLETTLSQGQEDGEMYAENKIWDNLVEK